MALQQNDFTGVYTSGTGVKYTYILRVSENVTTAEKTNLTIRAILKDSYGIRFSNWGTGVSCTVNGSEIFYDYKQRNYRGPGENVMLTWTGDVKHNGGKLTISGELWQDEPANWSPKKISVSGEMELSEIESTIRAKDAFIEDETTISIDSHDDSYTHVIGWKFGTKTGFVGSDGQTSDTAVKIAKKTIEFTVPDAFYEEIPDAPFGECILTVTTYSENKQIGRPNTAKFKASCDPVKCGPVYNCSIQDINEISKDLTGDEKAVVQYLSNVKCSFTEVTAKNGAKIATKKVNGIAITGDDTTIKGAKTGEFTFTVEDSRGFTGSTTIKAKKFVAYIYPTVNVACQRISPTSSEAVLKISGECFSGDFGNIDNAIYCEVTIGEEKWNPDEDDETADFTSTNHYEKNYKISGVEYDKSYAIEIAVRDNTGYTESRTIQLPKGIPVFDWGEDSFRFNVPVYIGEKTLEQYIKDIMNGG